MIVEATVANNNIEFLAPPQNRTAKPEQVEENRKKQDAAKAKEAKSAEKSEVQPEELLDQIKGLTEDGLYSVRFEKNEDIADVVVQIFDNESKEVVRQFPAEELIKFRSSFKELVGNLVDTKG